MQNAGLFAGQRFELINGDLIDKIGQSPPHASAVQLLLICLANLFGTRCIRVQLPLEAAPADRQRSVPEPDIAVVAEAKPDYRTRHPRGDETVLVAEVADSSVQHDATVKRDLYARAGVPEYWVLDLTARRLIVHRRLLDGVFQEIRVLPEDETVSLGALPPVPVSELLP